MRDNDVLTLLSMCFVVPCFQGVEYAKCFTMDLEVFLPISAPIDKIEQSVQMLPLPETHQLVGRERDSSLAQQYKFYSTKTYLH